jgi:hypothetical protein
MRGIRAAYTHNDLVQYQNAVVVPRSVRPVLLSFHPERSGQVVYQVMPNNVVGENGTNHGSHWGYDTHVPMMWLGSGITKGLYTSKVSPADIVPTLMALLQIRASLPADGRPLEEMFDAASVRVQEGDEQDRSGERPSMQ